MSGISRRDFLRSAATYAATAGFLSSGALELSASAPDFVVLQMGIASLKSAPGQLDG